MADHIADNADRPLGHHHPLGTNHLLGNVIQRNLWGVRSLSILDLSTFFPSGFPDVDDLPDVEENPASPNNSASENAVNVQRSVDATSDGRTEVKGNALQQIGGSLADVGNGRGGAIARKNIPSTSEQASNTIAAGQSLPSPQPSPIASSSKGTADSVTSRGLKNTDFTSLTTSSNTVISEDPTPLTQTGQISGNAETAETSFSSTDESRKLPSTETLLSSSEQVSRKTHTGQPLDSLAPSPVIPVALNATPSPAENQVSGAREVLVPPTGENLQKNDINKALPDLSNLAVETTPPEIDHSSKSDRSPHSDTASVTPKNIAFSQEKIDREFDLKQSLEAPSQTTSSQKITHLARKEDGIGVTTSTNPEFSQESKLPDADSSQSGSSVPTTDYVKSNIAESIILSEQVQRKTPVDQSSSEPFNSISVSSNNNYFVDKNESSDPRKTISGSREKVSIEPEIEQILFDSVSSQKSSELSRNNTLSKDEIYIPDTTEVDHAVQDRISAKSDPDISQAIPFFSTPIGATENNFAQTSVDESLIPSNIELTSGSVEDSTSSNVELTSGSEQVSRAELNPTSLDPPSPTSNFSIPLSEKLDGKTNPEQFSLDASASPSISDAPGNTAHSTNSINSSQVADSAQSLAGRIFREVDVSQAQPIPPSVTSSASTKSSDSISTADVPSQESNSPLVELASNTSEVNHPHNPTMPPADAVDLSKSDNHSANGDNVSLLVDSVLSSPEQVSKKIEPNSLSLDSTSAASLVGESQNITHSHQESISPLEESLTSSLGEPPEKFIQRSKSSPASTLHPEPEDGTTATSMGSSISEVESSLASSEQASKVFDSASSSLSIHISSVSSTKPEDSINSIDRDIYQSQTSSSLSEQFSTVDSEASSISYSSAAPSTKSEYAIDSTERDVFQPKLVSPSPEQVFRSVNSGSSLSSAHPDVVSFTQAENNIDTLEESHGHQKELITPLPDQTPQLSVPSSTSLNTNTESSESENTFNSSVKEEVSQVEALSLSSERVLRAFDADLAEINLNSVTESSQEPEKNFDVAVENRVSSMKAESTLSEQPRVAKPELPSGLSPAAPLAESEYAADFAEENDSPQGTSGLSSEQISNAAGSSASLPSLSSVVSSFTGSVNDIESTNDIASPEEMRDSSLETFVGSVERVSRAVDIDSPLPDVNTAALPLGVEDSVLPLGEDVVAQTELPSSLPEKAFSASNPHLSPLSPSDTVPSSTDTKNSIHTIADNHISKITKLVSSSLGKISRIFDPESSPLNILPADTSSTQSPKSIPPTGETHTSQILDSTTLPKKFAEAIDSLLSSSKPSTVSTSLEAAESVNALMKEHDSSPIESYPSLSEQASSLSNPQPFSQRVPLVNSSNSDENPSEVVESRVSAQETDSSAPEEVFRGLEPTEVQAGLPSLGATAPREGFDPAEPDDTPSILETIPPSSSRISRLAEPTITSSSSHTPIVNAPTSANVPSKIGESSVSVQEVASPIQEQISREIELTEAQAGLSSLVATSPEGISDASEASDTFSVVETIPSSSPQISKLVEPTITVSSSLTLSTKPTLSEERVDIADEINSVRNTEFDSLTTEESSMVPDANQSSSLSGDFSTSSTTSKEVIPLTNGSITPVVIKVAGAAEHLSKASDATSLSYSLNASKEVVTASQGTEELPTNTNETLSGSDRPPSSPLTTPSSTSQPSITANHGSVLDPVVAGGYELHPLSQPPSTDGKHHSNNLENSEGLARSPEPISKPKASETSKGIASQLSLMVDPATPASSLKAKNPSQQNDQPSQIQRQSLELPSIQTGEQPNVQMEWSGDEPLGGDGGRSPASIPPESTAASSDVPASLLGILQPIGVLQPLTSETLLRKRTTETTPTAASSNPPPLPSSTAAPAPANPELSLTPVPIPSDLPSSWASLADLLAPQVISPPNPSQTIPTGKIPDLQASSANSSPSLVDQKTKQSSTPTYSPARRQLSVPKRQSSTNAHVHVQAQFTSSHPAQNQSQGHLIQAAQDTPFTTITADTNTPVSAQNLERLAQEIYYLLRQRMAIEQERHGRIYPKRFN